MCSAGAEDAVANCYEKQLYTVFKTFDVDNTEALDRAAVHALCDSLQLEDRGAALLSTLFERRVERVTFTQFRNGLLAVLGNEHATPPTSSESDRDNDPPDRTHPPPSDEESSGCEVAPRFVFGNKKYGRRSRPQRASDTTPASRSSSASRLDTVERHSRSRAELGRSASAVDARFRNPDPPRLDPTRRIDRAGALALCRGLSMDGVDGLVDRIFEDASDDEPTVGDFFGRLNAALATTIEEAREPSTTLSPTLPDGLDDEAATGVPVDLFIEVWERAGVPRPRALLLELGFGGPTVRPPELERALDEELRALPASDKERALLLVAALSASRLRSQLARRRAEAATAERDKLRADVAEANARACLLAQEVDENHARIETELKASLRRAEARHADAARAAAAEASAERERAAAADARLQTETMRRSELEARLRTEAEELRVRLCDAETRAAAAEERLATLERDRERLAAEASLVPREDPASSEGGSQVGGEQLTARVDALSKQNKILRDRNDELVAELETCARHSGTSVSVRPEPGGDLSAELADLLPPRHTEESESSPVSLEQFASEMEVECESCRTLRDIITTLQHCTSSELKMRVAVPTMSHSECGTQTDIEVDLQSQLEEAHRVHDQDRTRLEALVKELELGLEQMKSEYERCEEYWSNKMESERLLHSEEMQAGDERLAELVTRVHEYEAQFTRSLPTIDEKYSLEIQVTELEDEFNRYRHDKEKELADRDRDIQRLRDRVNALERQRQRDTRQQQHSQQQQHQKQTVSGECSAGAAGACAGAAGVGAGVEVRELRGRAARAEAAVRRLHARLAAADLLVKDLYVENCHLAHRNHL